MFDLLASADLLVADAPTAAERLTQALGVLPARGAFLQRWPDWGFESHWCRVARRLPRAPTHVEIIAPYGAPDPAIGHPYIAEIYAAQQPRPYKTHSTPVAVADLAAIQDRLDAAGATYRLDEPEGMLPFTRLWLGRTADNPGAYDPAGDGGLYLEFIATQDMGFPILTEPVAPEPLPGEGLVRVDARLMLVTDLDAVLRTLERSLGWGPAGPVIATGGTRRVRLGFTHVHSAALELVSPGDDGPEGSYLRRWGPGPYGMRLEVDSLAQSAARLDECGIRYARREQTGLLGGALLAPDPDQLFGAQFELVATAV